MEKLLVSDNGLRLESLLDLGDVSALTKIKVGTLRKLMLRKLIPYIKVGGSVRFRASEIDGWLNGLGNEKRIGNKE